MQNEIILLIVGVAVVFIGVTILRLIKNNPETKRSAQEKPEDDTPSRNRKGETNNWPAQLRLVETPTPSIFEEILEKTWAQENITIRPLEDKDVLSRDFQKTIRLKESFSRNIYANRKKFSTTIRTYQLAQAQVLGRDKDCEIALSEINVSRRHALIKFEIGNYVIYDISSTSGVYLNSSRVSSQGVILKHNDLIIIGLTVLIFEGNPPRVSHKLSR